MNNGRKFLVLRFFLFFYFICLNVYPTFLNLIKPSIPNQPFKKTTYISWIRTGELRKIINKPIDNVHLIFHLRSLITSVRSDIPAKIVGGCSINQHASPFFACSCPRFFFNFIFFFYIQLQMFQWQQLCRIIEIYILHQEFVMICYFLYDC